MKTPKPIHNQSAQALPKGWREVRLGDVAEMIMGQSPKSETYNKNGEGLPFYQGIVDFGDRFTIPRVYCSSPKKVIEAGDILLSVRAPVGQVNFTKERCSIGRGNAGLRMKRGIQNFLFYLLKFSENQFHSNSSGSVFSSINKSNIENLQISIPPLPEQKAIAEVLSSLDDKIDLLHRQNKTLEDMAQTLFRQWFIEQADESWEEKPLGDLVSVKRGGSPRPIQEYISDSGYRWLKISDATKEKSPFIFEIKEHIKETGLSKTTLKKSGSLVLSNSATPGIPKILQVDSCIHDGWLHFPEAYFSNEFLYLLFKRIRPALLMQGNGSIFINLKTDILKEYKILVPPRIELNNFQDSVKIKFEKLLSNATQIRTLENLRDTLLPKLMSGEVRMK